MKLYAVAKGNTTGIFDNWDQCKEAVNGYPNAKFKKVKSYQEGEEYIAEFGVKDKEVNLFDKANNDFNFKVIMNCDTEEQEKFFESLRTHMCYELEDYVEKNYREKERIVIDVSPVKKV